MNRRIKMWKAFCWIVVLAFLSSGYAAQATTFDVADDFSATNNPNGVWSYGWSSTLTSALNLYPNYCKSHNIDHWAGSNCPYSPNVAHNGTGSINNDHWTITWQPGQFSLHPGDSGEYSHARWTAPDAGTIDIASMFTGIDHYFGTTTDVHVLHNGISLFDGEVNGFNDTASFSTTVSVGVGMGDIIDFAVGYGSNQTHTCDTTALSATINFIPEPALGVTVDIKPRSCPNPLNVKGKGVLPVAILGSADFDVHDIDVATILLQGVDPNRSSYEDVAGPVLAGLIAYWSFDDAGALGHDDSGNGHDGTVNGAVSTDGICGKALSFDGVDNYVKVNDSDNLDITSKITLEAWIKADSLRVTPLGPDALPDNQILSKWDHTNAQRSYWLGIREKKLLFTLTSDGTLNTITYLESPTILDTGKWYHIAATYDGDVMKIYLDGKLDVQVSRTDDIFVSTVPLYIGTYLPNVAGHGAWFDGFIDEVRIYDRALSASEIAALAEQCHDGNGCECTTEGPDGFEDLTLKFNTQEIVGAIGPVADSDELVLELTGLLHDDTPITGADCIIIRAKGKK